MELITGRIYIIKTFQNENIYIGSTIQTIKRRFTKHKYDYIKYNEGKGSYNTAYEIIKYDDCYVELIKEVVCTRKQLFILEGEEITKLNNCINLRIAGNSFLPDYSKARCKTYYHQNKEKFKESRRLYYLEHKK